MMPTVLVVEDNRIDRQIAVQALGKQFSVDEATNGVEGLAKATATPYDLIMLDVEMPEMDGREMLRSLRSEGIQTPVILVTGEVRTSVIGDLMMDGISNYIVKPVPPNELLAKATLVLEEIRLSNKGKGESGDDSTTEDVALRVLLVDDMKPVEESLSEHLADEVTLCGVYTRDAALDRARLEDWDLLLVDMEMPDIDAVALALELKKECPGSRVIGMFLRDVAQARLDARRYGLDGFIYKPFDATEVASLMVDNGRDAADVVTVDGNTLALNQFPEESEQHDQHITRVLLRAQEECRALAAACYPQMVLDLSVSPPADCLPRILDALKVHCEGLGLTLVGDAAGSSELQSILNQAGVSEAT